MKIRRSFGYLSSIILNLVVTFHGHSATALERRKFAMQIDRYQRSHGNRERDEATGATNTNNSVDKSLKCAKVSLL